MKKKLHRFYEKKILNFRELIKFFISFYLIGVIGLSWSCTYPVFVKLTPLALILSFSALIIFHKEKIRRGEILVFASVFIAGFLVEAVGVNTGKIFGTYRYGSGLGLKLFETPLLIGLNWLFMVYTTHSLARRISKKGILVVLLAASFMLGYDLIMEQVAPKIDLWYWKNNTIPVQNYLAWYALAMIFNFLFVIFKVNTSNRFAPYILGFQTLFFVALFFLL